MDLRVLIIVLSVALLASCSETTEVTQRSPKAIYAEHCELCHGSAGNAQISGAKDLSVSSLNLKEVQTIIRNGRRIMRPYKDVLSEEEIKQVSDYVMTLRSQ